MRKLKTNMRYLMQLRQSPSMVVPRAEASPCPCEITGEKNTHAQDIKYEKKEPLEPSCQMLAAFSFSDTLD